jgi:xanthine dehydrogenase large subunit
VKVRADRDDDMLITGKRHDFVTDYDVASTARVASSASSSLAGRCGYSADLSRSINDARCSSDNCYYLGDVGITSYRCKTNTQSNTRSAGGPQGMIGIEQVVDEIAPSSKDPLDVRRLNFYGTKDRNVTHYPGDCRQRDSRHCRRARSADYRRRRADPRVEPRQPVPQARHCAHARQVRHFVHGHALEPGRRADSRLYRWNGPSEPQRH